MKECKNCKKEVKGRGSTYCSNSCQLEFQRKSKLNEWFEGANFTRQGGTSIPNWMRDFLLEETNHTCESCGWGETNVHTGKIPLEIDHIDGDAYNNARENLRVLCPNCHSLTKTYKNAGSRKSTRTYRKN